jgi:hypothetical protein
LFGNSWQKVNRLLLSANLLVLSKELRYETSARVSPHFIELAGGRYQRTTPQRRRTYDHYFWLPTFDHRFSLCFGGFATAAACQHCAEVGRQLCKEGVFWQTREGSWRYNILSCECRAMREC